MKLQSDNTTCIKYYVSRSQKILRKNLVVAFLEEHKESMNIDNNVRPYSYKGSWSFLMERLRAITIIGASILISLTIGLYFLGLSMQFCTSNH